MNSALRAEIPVSQDRDRTAFLEAEQRKWLMVEEAAFILRTSIDTMLKAIHRNQVALFAEGKVWRIHVDSLAQCQKTLAEWKAQN